MRPRRIFSRLGAFALAAFALHASAETVNGITFLGMVSTYLNTPLEDRASGQMPGDAHRARNYISEFLDRNEPVARCLPLENRVDVAALFAMSMRPSVLGSIFGNGESLLADAIAPGGVCRAEGDFIRAVLRTTAWPGANVRLTGRNAVADLLLDASRGDVRHAACLAQSGTRSLLVDGAAGYLGSLPSSAGAEAERTRVVAAKAAERACDPAPAPRTYPRDGSPVDPWLPEENKGACKREGGFSPAERLEPVFPRRAIAAGIDQASVVVHLRVGRDGVPSALRVQDVKPAQFQGVFDRAITSALFNWRWPEGCPFIAEFELNFRLTD